MFFNLEAKPFIPTQKVELSSLAKPFFPQSFIDENEFFDKLERKFVAENRFIFDYVDEPEFMLKYEHKEFEKVRGHRIEFKNQFKVTLPLIVEEPKIKSWAEIVSVV
jgi:hypothetical protein